VTWTGGPFGSVAQCVLAPNASPMTLDGTNTWVLRAPGSSRSVVVDPGPPVPSHLDAVAAAAGDVAVVLLTHHHLDHSEAARAFAERVGCGVRALDPAYRLGPEGLGEGDVVAVGDLEVRVVATPGHSSDSLSFVIPSERAVLTGDTVLGRGTTVVAHPDGELGAYLASLDRLHALAEAHDIDTIWPGHGPVIDQALPVLDHYLAHRRERLDQVREALRTISPSAVPLDDDSLTDDSLTDDSLTDDSLTDDSLTDDSLTDDSLTDDSLTDDSLTDDSLTDDSLAHRVVEIVYADVDPILWPAAELSVRAQLAYLHR
jgi:glyoxylase-like metal-dependent hydrolase (beta-lactamase superfamily II)